MKKILFIMLIGLIFGCSSEPEVEMVADTTVDLEAKSLKTAAIPPTPTPTAIPPTPEYSINLEFATKMLPLYSFIYLNDFGLEILNSGGLEDGPVKAKWSFYNKEDFLIWEKDFDLIYIDGKTEKTLDGKTVNYWLSAGENSWPSVQVVIVTERLFSSSFISINGGNKIPFFNINVSGNTY